MIYPKATKGLEKNSRGEISTKESRKKKELSLVVTIVSVLSSTASASEKNEDHEEEGFIRIIKLTVC